MMHPKSVVETIEPKQRRARRQSSELDLLLDVNPSDGALVLRAQSGERSAFNALVRKYRHRVMKVSMRYTGNRADAEDVVQNTFFKAYWALQSFRGESAFYSWLHRIAINAAKTMLSLRAHNAGIFVSNIGDAERSDDPSTTLTDLDTPEELALTDEICSAVNASIEALCEEQRTAIVLREFEGLSYSQVASAMSCPVGTVRSRVFRAREAIDKTLKCVFDDGLGRAKHKVSRGSRQMCKSWHLDGPERTTG
jgi:RNA polymerase sigma-70 factor (ECF subfamily)